MTEHRNNEVNPDRSGFTPAAVRPGSDELGAMEASEIELARFIAFTLNNLSASNGHFQFEQVCRQVAMRRIASNILPATGPVAAGGDQGRDFETFHSLLRSELGENGVFLGLASDEPLVFICTLQQQNLKTKVLADVGKVLAGARRPAGIYVFCGVNVPVAQRHDLETEVGELFDGRFEVWDLNALSEHLSQPDLFPVAEQLLDLPATLAPRTPTQEETPGWYVADRQRWQDRSMPRPTLGEILDLKDGLRHATRAAQARNDLPLWLSLARVLTADDVPLEVRHRARYEVIWAIYQSQGDLRPVDDLIRAFFVDLLAVDPVEPNLLEDASVLLTSASTAYIHQQTAIASEELKHWVQTLRDRVRAALDSDLSTARRVQLLEVLGFLAIDRDPDRLEILESPERVVDILELVDASGDLPQLAVPLIGWEPLDVHEAMWAWCQLASLLQQAPLFPVDRFSIRLSQWTPLLVDDPRWRELADAVDAAVRRSSGDAAAAASAHRRAVSLRDAGRVRAALQEMHAAKIQWWSGDTVRESLLAMLFIADCYRELRLPEAGIQHALAASYAASGTSDDSVLYIVPVGLLVASEIAYESGAWYSAVELVELGLLAQNSYVDVEASELAQSQLARAAATLGWCLRLGRVLAPGFAPFVEATAQKFDLLETLDEIDRSAPVEDREQLLERVDAQLLGRPLCDAGHQRVIRFAALGTDWTVVSSNRFEDARAAERFAAAAEIALVEMAESELCLMPSAINVLVEAVDDLEPGDRLHWAPTDAEREWRVRLTSVDENGASDVAALSLEVARALLAILRDVSVLPTHLYAQVVEDAFERGLNHKLTMIRTYDELGVPRGRYNLTPRERGQPPSDPAGYPAQAHGELAWPSGEGPGYDPDDAQTAIAARYDFVKRAMPNTLARLRDDEGFQRLVRELRADGWRDWHLLQALANAALNARLRQEGLGTAEQVERMSERAHELMQSEDLEENDDAPLAPTREDLVFSLQSSIPSTMMVWNLELDQTSPDWPALYRFLEERYRYWSDDIEHDDPFPESR